MGTWASPWIMLVSIPPLFPPPMLGPCTSRGFPRRAVDLRWPHLLAHCFLTSGCFRCSRLGTGGGPTDDMGKIPCKFTLNSLRAMYRQVPFPLQIIQSFPSALRLCCWLGVELIWGGGMEKTVQCCKYLKYEVIGDLPCSRQRTPLVKALSS